MAIDGLENLMEACAWGKDQVLNKMHNDGIITSTQRDYYKLNFCFVEYKRSFFSELWKDVLGNNNVDVAEYRKKYIRMMMDATPERPSMNSNEGRSDDTDEETINNLRNLVENG